MMTRDNEIACLRMDLDLLENRLKELEQEPKETPFQVSMRKNIAVIDENSFKWEKHKLTWNDALEHFAELVRKATEP